MFLLYYQRMSVGVAKDISKGIQELRRQRRLSQAEFAELLNISQSQFSKIENGQSSLTAEQFLFLLQHFNVPLSDFVKTQDPEDESSALQNALIRFGAKHLTENKNVFVPETFHNINEVIFQTLVIHPSARLIASLAPVIARNFNKINFLQIENKLREKNGNANRLWWVLENTLATVSKRLEEYIPFRKLEISYRRCGIPLLSQLHFQERNSKSLNSWPEDILDVVHSEKTLETLRKNQDELAKKWNILTSIKQSDFADALIQAEEYD